MLVAVPVVAKTEVKKAAEEGKVEVIFSFAEHLDAKSIFVAGEFNDWNPAHKDWKMTKKDGVWRLSKKLVQGKEYQYKFTIPSGEKVKWIKDKEADKFKDDGFGGENSVVIAKIVKPSKK
nr:isoamylase early set domain-containing protein [Halanaerobacter jeridensis]